MPNLTFNMFRRFNNTASFEKNDADSFVTSISHFSTNNVRRLKIVNIVTVWRKKNMKNDSEIRMTYFEPYFAQLPKR